METYIVRINGVEYEVEVERKGEGAPAKPAPPKAPKTGSGEPVVCGTSGSVFKVVCHEGQEVKTGDTVVILEAMKMEIPMVAPASGTISEIFVSEGQPVEAGDRLLVIA